MTTNNNKDIERIISEFDTLFPVIDDIATTSELLDAIEVVSAYPDKIKGWLRTALTTYADQRVREYQDNLDHEQQKLVDGFGHPKDCQKCNQPRQ